MIVASDHPQTLEAARKAYLVSRLGGAGAVDRVVHARLMSAEGVDAMLRELAR